MTFFASYNTKKEMFGGMSKLFFVLFCLYNESKCEQGTVIWKKSRLDKMEGSSLDILLNIFFCVPQKKEMHTVWNDIRVSKNIFV